MQVIVEIPLWRQALGGKESDRIFYDVFSTHQWSNSECVYDPAREPRCTECNKTYHCNEFSRWRRGTWNGNVNTMLAMPFSISTHNVGNVDSIANIVFLGGSERFACPQATFMFHGIGFQGNANERLEEKALQEKLDIVLTGHKRLSSIIASRTNKLSILQGMRLFKEQRTRDAAWAKASGIVDDVRDFVYPTGSNILLFVQ